MSVTEKVTVKEQPKFQQEVPAMLLLVVVQLCARRSLQLLLGCKVMF